ncbi:hypothetical protein TNCV_3285361 [Trichonephila clavipes]|nr:hypothetical protein TNCV_3285361 [Trichonephila clavipes]
MDLLPAFHEFEPSTIEDLPCKVGRYTFYMSRSHTSSYMFAVEVKVGGARSGVRPRHLPWLKITRSVSESPRVAE